MSSCSFTKLILICMYIVQKLRIRHTIDIMHVEKNVSASILGYLLGERDTVSVRKDMEAAGVNEELHLRPRPGRGNYLKPHPPYSFKSEEQDAFLKQVKSVKVPSTYSAGMMRHVSQRKLHGLKSHDHHVLLQDIIPATIRGLLCRGARDAVIRLGHCFKKICQKAIDPNEMLPLQQYVAETMCLLEVWFPPAFFDIMPHLVLHLVDELDWLGPVYARWCYGAERYLYVLKKYVRNRNKPEASIATGYLYAEALGFMAEHLSIYPGWRRIWDPEDDDRSNGEVVEGAPLRRVMPDAELRMIHEFVISNYQATEALRR